jgi:hypothetical protein
MICTKAKALALGFFIAAAAGPVLYAQTDLRVAFVPTVCVYIAPIEGGTPKEQEYFMFNMRMEFSGAAYEVVDRARDSHYTVTLSISREWPGDSNLVTLILSETKTGREIISLSQNYQEVEDMNAWNLYLITQAMANTPTIKMPPDGELILASNDERLFFSRKFFLGLRGGGIMNTSIFRTSGNYEGGVSHGFSGEGALLAEYHWFRFFSIQMEAAVAYDTFSAARQVQIGPNIVRSTSTFRALNLMVPLLIKIPLRLDSVTLSPYGGIYYTMTLPIGDEAKYSMTPPLGASLGFEVAFPLWRGEFFAGIRSDQNFGTTIIENGPRFARNKTGIMLGYKFALWTGQRKMVGQQKAAEKLAAGDERLPEYRPPLEDQQLFENALPPENVPLPPENVPPPPENVPPPPGNVPPLENMPPPLEDVPTLEDIPTLEDEQAFNGL